MKPAARPPIPPGPYLVAGLGKAGMAAASALAGRGAPVMAWERQAGTSARDRARALEHQGVRVVLGGDGLDALDQAGESATVIKSPGIDPWVPVLAEAQRRGLDVVDELELGWRLADAPVVAVTGTNGKSTTCALVQRVLAAAGTPGPVVGNTEWGPPLSAAPGDSDCLVCEVSSFQLESSPCFLPEVAVFTNLTLEHLPRHGTMQSYGAAKRRMFVRADRASGAAAINTDDTFGARLAEEVEREGGRVLRYGRGEGADILVEAASWDATQSRVRLRAGADTAEVLTRLPGEHNALNLAGAVAAAGVVGIPLSQAAAALEGAVAPPGRWEPIVEGQDFDVVVDYAHTPDGLTRSLGAARAVVEGRPGARLRAVFGAVGVPDPEKAAGCGRAVGALADHVILTTGSAPRGPRVPRMLELARAADGQADVELVLDRRKAIRRAVSTARPGDVVTLLGLGALGRQTLDARGTTIALDDREVAREELRVRAAG